MRTFTRVLCVTLIALFAAALSRDAAAGALKELRLDYAYYNAYYNPVSLVLKDKGWLEEDLQKMGSGSSGF